MFRNPRERPEVGSVSSNPSIGRPPTPPSSSTFATHSVPTVTMMETPKRMQGTPKSKPTSASKNKPKANASILSFFKKAEVAPEQDASDLFVTDNTAPRLPSILNRTPSSDKDVRSFSRAVEDRYNENEGSVKKLKTDLDHTADAEYRDIQGTDNVIPLREVNTNASSTRISLESTADAKENTDKQKPISTEKRRLFEKNLPSRSDSCSPLTPIVPALKQEETSMGEDMFDGIEDFMDDEFAEEGEEFTERLWLQEQRALEREFEDGDGGSDEIKEEEASTVVPSQVHDTGEQETESSCPICNESLNGLSTDQASMHVNHCLDGDPLPVSRPAPKSETPIKLETEKIVPHKRFQAAAIPRPPQENPFQLGTSSKGGSAFSKILSSHAEDEAWSTAAANEVASRGKPAFKRTCPFYKILPGFFTCVDAFRYGAVEGCNAYFLSHFHSDHYIGLTSTWCHGPIYCSHVTANLVRQQLRVDPKWVVDLEFEQKTEIPATQGVFVTMIPANHCPGSSLYLFEKAIGKGPNPKLQRVLHCGDFRACPAHCQHPLLRPDVIDAVTGNKRQQKLDVCYLDTTYLTPKYAFPNQEQVIKACADMCVSLSKEKVDENDSWEQTKKQRAGNGMVKFVKSESVKQENEDEEIGGIVSVAKKEGKKRGRLLVIVGTYSIGKERICLGVAKALNSKIFAPPGKQRICKALEDPELNSRLTTNPLEAQVHMQMLMEIRAETLADYLTGYKPHFTRIVGFRPSGWNYRPPQSRFLESPSVQTVLHSDNWKTKYSMAELVPQRGSTREASCFGVPYSEHSSFRELSMFCCSLRIDKIIPTVNVGSAKSREKMKVWIDKWTMDKKKNGLFQVPEDMREWS